ncbi:hypothetical protein B296_00043635 [Ensete ventricosum]|uniref:Uncharacterized protein n=1 Tax=Ensete ventricosum TaxID=4639 RepID=A0A426Y4Y8_ENSVE|nr:hypothetical protein B296_00043635 [Ensete ventricosum]
MTSDATDAITHATPVQRRLDASPAIVDVAARYLFDVLPERRCSRLHQRGGNDSGSRGRERWVAAQEVPTATVVAAAEAAAVVATESSVVAGPNGDLRQQAAARSGLARSFRGDSNGKAAPLVGGPTWRGRDLGRSSLGLLRKGLRPTEDACERGGAAQQ